MRAILRRRLGRDDAPHRMSLHRFTHQIQRSPSPNVNLHRSTSAHARVPSGLDQDVRQIGAPVGVVGARVEREPRHAVVDDGDGVGSVLQEELGRFGVPGVEERGRAGSVDAGCGGPFGPQDGADDFGGTSVAGRLVKRRHARQTCVSFREDLFSVHFQESFHCRKGRVKAQQPLQRPAGSLNAKPDKVVSLGVAKDRRKIIPICHLHVRRCISFQNTSGNIQRRVCGQYRFIG
mmetsp:Transcript_40290/g.121350  ORF Transcript_40290/g.121350 Transcript_40290/m.121350 type:complete len:234 (+) Transcript_40290:813-1514(+)